MSSNLVIINNVQVERIAHKNRPVVTLTQIAAVHGVPVKTIESAFRRNRERFIEGEDYLALDFAEAKSLLLLSEGVSPNGMHVFTENGYLLLVKPLRDDVSWQVQRRMRDAYFAQQGSPNIASPWDIMAQLVASGRQQEQQLKALEAAERRHDQALIAQQQQLLEVIQGQAWVTIHQYVTMRRLERQMPLKLQQEYGHYLAGYCLEKGYRAYPVPVAHQAWKDEKSYWIEAINGTLPDWLVRRNGQPDLRIIEGGSHA